MRLHDAGPAHKPNLAAGRWHMFALFVFCAAILDAVVGYVGWLIWDTRF